MEEKSEDWTYKGSPFLNIGPHVQKEYYEKPIDPNYPAKHKCEQYQIHPLIHHGTKVENAKEYYENKYEYPFITNQGYRIVIKEYVDRNHVLVEFLNSGYQTWTTINAVKNGCVYYPFHPNRFGSYIGDGEYNKSNRNFYSIWESMFNRCLIGSSKFHDSYLNKVTIDFDWYNFQNFAKWMDSYLSKINPKYHEELQLDKDILQWGVENKIYGPNTCCLIPRKINRILAAPRISKKYLHGVHKNLYHYSVTLITDHKYNCLGTYKTQEEAFQVYKQAKEQYLKELADYYYSENAILKEIRDLLYKISIQSDGSQKMYGGIYNG